MIDCPDLFGGGKKEAGKASPVFYSRTKLLWRDALLIRGGSEI